MTVMDIQSILNELMELERDAVASMKATTSLPELDEARVKFLGKKSRVTEIMSNLGALSKEEKPKVGQRGNEVRQSIQAAHDERKQSLDRAELDARLATERIDVTLPGKGIELGHLHPLTQIKREIIEVFYGLGYTLEDGPR